MSPVARGAALSGSLQDLPLPELLPLLVGAKHTGVVELRGAAAGMIALDAGSLTLALADDGPTLQQVVVDSGITDADGWERAHTAALRGAGLADALIDEGADEDHLRHVVREQTIGALFEFLLPSDTSFAFLPGATHPMGRRFVFDHDELLAEAADRVSAWKVIAETIPSVQMVMRLTPELRDASLTISAADWKVLACVDGRATVADIIRTLGMSAFAVCAVLHQLVLNGCVEAVPT